MFASRLAAPGLCAAPSGPTRCASRLGAAALGVALLAGCNATRANQVAPSADVAAAVDGDAGGDVDRDASDVDTASDVPFDAGVGDVISDDATLDDTGSRAPDADTLDDALAVHDTGTDVVDRDVPIPPGPPVAVAKCTRVGSGLALSSEVRANAFESVRCSAEGSVRADRYEWRVRAAPSGSGAAFDDATAPTPTIALDLYGRYELELVVVDAAGGRSDPRVDPYARVSVVPEWPGQLHAQVSWNDADDRPPTTGVDLHVVHERGCWGDPVWDCHGANRSPEWGEVGGRPQRPYSDAPGDPAGVVNVGLEYVDAVSYRVGVAWESGNGADMVVRVYLRAALVYEHLVPVSDDGSPGFWAGLVLDAATGEVERIEQVTATYPACR